MLGDRGVGHLWPSLEYLGNQVALLRGCQMPAVKVEGEGDGIRIAARDVLALNSLGSADPACGLRMRDRKEYLRH